MTRPAMRPCALGLLDALAFCEREDCAVLRGGCRPNIQPGTEMTVEVSWNPADFDALREIADAAGGHVEFGAIGDPIRVRAVPDLWTGEQRETVDILRSRLAHRRGGWCPLCRRLIWPDMRGGECEAWEEHRP
jgi:hypothetical protein